MKHLFQFILFTMLALLYSGCTHMIINDFEPTQKISTQQELKKNIDHFALPLLQNNINVGLVVSTFNHNQTNTFSYGYKNIEKKLPMQKDTIFALGSVGKTLVLSLLLVLEDKGLIDYDETIGDIFPSTLSYADDKVKNITLKQLALHNSGLPREPYNHDSLFAMIKYFFTGDNIYGHIDTAYTYDYLSQHILEPIRDDQALYSNLGMGILSYAISLKMNMSLEDLLQKHILKPLNMNDTVITFTAEQQKKLATGYVGEFPLFMRRNTVLENWKFSAMMEGTGSIYSTAPDLVKLLKAHLGVSNTSLDTIFKKGYPLLTHNEELSCTLSWQVQQIKKYNTNIYYKYGVIAGFSAYMGMHLPTKTAIVVLKNNFNWDETIGHNMLLRMALGKQ
ncbi:MAG: serine hydrolase domain-containing protein [Campylobacterota bacterium]|nr:serine hydrolase domain-containing protein [Campylobacterota bacterium]